MNGSIGVRGGADTGAASKVRPVLNEARLCNDQQVVVPLTGRSVASMPAAAKKAAASKPSDKSPEKDAPKRKSYTDEEKIAKLEAEMAEVRAKAKAKREKAAESKSEEMTKLVAKRDELNVKIAELQTEIDGLTVGGSIFGEDLDAGDDPVVTAQDEATAAATTDAA